MIGARRRRRTGPILAVLAVVLVAAFLGLSIHAAKPSRQTLHQEARTYLDLAYPLVQESNHASSTVDQIRSNPAALGPTGLTNALDSLVAETTKTERSLLALSVPSSLRSQAADLERTMKLRAEAARMLRSGMTMALDPGSSGPAAGTLVQAGELMSGSDSSYADFRRAIPGWAGGRRSMPVSQWVPGSGIWAQGPIGDFVNAVNAAASAAGPLAPNHDLLLLVVIIQPTPLSTQPNIVLPSTSQMSPTIVVANIGNEPESNIQVQATLQATSGSPRAQTQYRSIPKLQPGARRAVAMGNFQLSSGTTYVLSSSITPVPGETATSNNHLSLTLQDGT